MTPAPSNMEIYNAVRRPPAEALKRIEAGRLKGRTDINPMWRIRALTEQFGLCGIGWGYRIIRQWSEPGSGGEIAAFCTIELWYKLGGVMSEPIPGTGGSSFVAKETKGLYTSDECYKMALTDAISVAAKALGVAADVYWQADPTKYTAQQQPSEPPQQASAAPPQTSSPESMITRQQARELIDIATARAPEGEPPAEYFARVTGFRSSVHVPESMFEDARARLLGLTA